MGKFRKQIPLWKKEIYQTKKGLITQKELKVQTVYQSHYQEEIDINGIRTEITPMNRKAWRITASEERRKK